MENIQSVVSSDALSKVLSYIGTHMGPVLARLSVGQKVSLALGGAGLLLGLVDTVCRNGYQVRIRLGDVEFVLCRAGDDLSADEAEVIDLA